MVNKDIRLTPLVIADIDRLINDSLKLVNNTAGSAVKTEIFKTPGRAPWEQGRPVEVIPFSPLHE